MTYGEALQKRKDETVMINGKFVAPHIEEHIKLNKRETLEHFNDKLYVYWLTQISDSKIKNKKLDYLLGRFKSE